jgi:hypothetical protein
MNDEDKEWTLEEEIEHQENRLDGRENEEEDERYGDDDGLP